MVSCFNGHTLIIRNAFDNLKPGGWVEYQDFTSDPHCIDGPEKLEGSTFKKMV
ncbi:hypothetical protein B0O99DRAFT_638846 [Bisporella sp. PMI_857]|nr:hypothetical protein B0O99DRAFT_638846 [Bisporella sp. PMI_857]